MQLQHYTWLIWHRLWLIITGIVLCTGATYAISSHTAVTYEASVLIQVTAPNTSNGSDVFSNQALAVSDALLVTSDDVLRAAVKNLPGVTFDQLQQAVSAAPADNTELVQVRGDASTPDLAAAIANTVAQAFIDHQVASETVRLQGTADLLTQELATVKTNIDKTQADLTLLQHSSTALQSQIDQQTNLLNTYQLNYNSLLTSYNDIELQKATMARSLTIAQPATPPAQPLGSRKLLNTGIAAAMSLLLMVVLVLLLDWVDATIKTPEDVAQLALLEPLGSIPLRTKNPKLTSNPSLDDNRLERAFAIINTNFHALNTGQRSLLVTSLHPRTGSTTVATRLAIALAQSSTRVLLIDAHLRKPELHTLFHLADTRGLATCQADVQLLQKQPDQVYNWLDQWGTSEPNLWLLPVGSITGSPTAVLRSRELRKLVGWLLQEPIVSAERKMSAPVDIIIFDTPALEEEADTITLAPLCDSSILVVEAGKERKETLKKAQATLQRLGAPILGVVVNRQKASQRPYLYINQPQQGVFPTELPLPVTEVKYPLLKAQTLPMRAIPKFSVPRQPSQGQDIVPKKQDTTPIKAVARTFAPSQTVKSKVETDNGL